jgi:DNA modification methylase
VVIHGDARSLPLADGSVQCVVTSPPYWGLRDYGLAPSVWDAAPGCAHVWGEEQIRRGEIWRKEDLNCSFATSQPTRATSTAWQQIEHRHAFCTRCPAWRGVLGLEPTPERYVRHLVECFREVRRVLRDDGTVWLNLGDSYAAGKQGRDDGVDVRGTVFHGQPRYDETAPKARAIPVGLKPKDLVGIPWRVAFALQADGWYLRADVIWAKPNPMPESVTDRPTKAHEYLFLLAKAERYFYDAEAVREPLLASSLERGYTAAKFKNGLAPKNTQIGNHVGFAITAVPNGRNRRSVWTIATEPYPEAHFATFPEALVAPCILAGTSERGACAACGAPWERETSSTLRSSTYGDSERADRPKSNDQKGAATQFGTRGFAERMRKSVETTGWCPTCACGADATVANLVLDPFAGSGTVGAVAERLGRRWVAVDLKPDYLGMAKRRTAQRGLVFA